jgi:hypothetical protein
MSVQTRSAIPNGPGISCIKNYLPRQLSRTSPLHTGRTKTREICALLEYYAASNGNPLPTFRDNVSVPSSRVKKSVKDCHSTLRSTPKERSPQQHSGGSLKSRTKRVSLFHDFHVWKRNCSMATLLARIVENYFKKGDKGT